MKITPDLRAVISELLYTRVGGANVDTAFPGVTEVNAFLP